jgi:antitoxin (DNA-binding transcriptional repressor) of toxin-antitoxin stability system
LRTIPQSTLRNESDAVLRQAEAGEQFVITVQGSTTDPTVLDDLRRLLQ